MIVQTTNAATAAPISSHAQPGRPPPSWLSSCEAAVVVGAVAVVV
jgi:hypothetical protein